MPVAHDTYQMEAFDCDEPQDIVTRSIPKSCNPEEEDEQETSLEEVALEDYTILQKVVNFEYNATLCTLRRSRQHFDCRTYSHVRIAAPARIYAQETMRVEDCMRAREKGVFTDPRQGTEFSFNDRAEVHYFESTPHGSLWYDETYAYCTGTDAKVSSGHRIQSLLTLESLEFTMREVTVREEFATGDVIIRENGVAIPAAYRGTEGMTMDFGTLVFH